MLSTWNWNCPAPQIPTVNYQPDFTTSGTNFWLQFPPTPSVTLTSTSSNLGFHSPGRAGGRKGNILLWALQVALRAKSTTMGIFQQTKGGCHSPLWAKTVVLQGQQNNKLANGRWMENLPALHLASDPSQSWINRSLRFQDFPPISCPAHHQVVT